MRNLSEESDSFVIEFKSASEFEKYIYKTPREYDMVIFFTANNCNLCNSMEDEFKKVASFYQQSGHLHEIKSEKETLKPVFFAKVIFGDEWRPIFMGKQPPYTYITI